MKPAWDSLMEEFADSKTALVADVDCTVTSSLYLLSLGLFFSAGSLFS